MQEEHINDNHRRALSAALKIVESRLNEFARIVLSTEDFATGQNEKLLESIKTAQNRVKRFRQDFNIAEPRRTHPAWLIQTGVAQLWEILEECKAHKLRGYGEVSETAQPVLDEAVSGLIEALREIAAAANAEKKAAPN